LYDGVWQIIGGVTVKLFRVLPVLLWRFRRELRLVWAMLRSPEAPWRCKLIAMAAFAYVISPIDLIPDFALVLGWLDDVAIFAGLIALSFKLLPKNVYDALQRQVDGQSPVDRQEADDRKPKSAPPREGRIIDVTPM
jgi:uncharacterized membrane protein YkvA (DUF1232 family)